MDKPHVKTLLNGLSYDNMNPVAIADHFISSFNGWNPLTVFFIKDTFALDAIGFVKNPSTLAVNLIPLQ